MLQNARNTAHSGSVYLFTGHGYYEFGLFRGFSFWYAEQVSREYTDASFRLLGFDSFEGLPQPQLDVEAAAFEKGDILRHV